MDKILQSGYYECLLRYNNVDWFADEVIKLGNFLVFCFKNTNEDINMTEEDEEDFRKKFFRFC